MSLVSYYSSSDDDKSSGEDETGGKTVSRPTSEGAPTGTPGTPATARQPHAAADVDAVGPTSKSNPSLFSSLPAPKSLQNLNEPEKLDTKQPPFLSTTGRSLPNTSRGFLNLPAPKKRSSQPIKITAPSLPETNSDDEEEEPSAKKSKPAKTKPSLGHKLVNMLPNSANVGRAISGPNHVTSRGHAELPNNCLSNVNPGSLGMSTPSTSESDDHTVEELVEFSRTAMEQLHKKLELQQQRMSLLSSAALSHANTNNAALLAPPLPAGWPVQGTPVLNPVLHPSVVPFMQAPGFDTQALGANGLSFAFPVNAAGVAVPGNQVNNLARIPTSIGLQPGLRLPFNAGIGVSNPQVYPSVVPNSRPPAPPCNASSESHARCCKACLKRIDVLEQKVGKILEHMINKELSQAAQMPSLMGSFQNVLPAPVSSNAHSASTSMTYNSTLTSPTKAYVEPRMPNKSLNSVQNQEQSLPSGSSAKLKTAHPPQPKDQAVPVRLTPTADNDKYTYQTLMRYRGTSKCFKMESEVNSGPVSNNVTDHGNNDQLSGDDSSSMDPATQRPPLIYSAAVFESLPPKIQNILNIVERDENGNVTLLEVKEDILVSLVPYIKDRGSISRRLADVLFTDDERCFCNCSGWRKPAALDPIRMQALSDAVFKLSPCPNDQKKHLWHECVKSIDAASRHIVRIRKNKGKIPRHGKWLPSSYQDDKISVSSLVLENDSLCRINENDNLPLRLESVLDVSHRDTSGRICKVEIKEHVLVGLAFLASNRLTVACELASTLFTQEERNGTSCSGRHNKPQLDPIRVDAIREATFKISPAPREEQKRLWSYCVKAIDLLSANPETDDPTSPAPVHVEIVTDDDHAQFLQHLVQVQTSPGAVNDSSLSE